MNRVVAIVGSYGKGGMTDQAVDAVLDGAREAGARTSKIYLADRHIEFCRNCRECTQKKGEQRGGCPQDDELDWVLGEIEDADGVVLASPVNFYNVTAIFRRFLERLIGYSYWPWGKESGPTMRSKLRTKRAILVASAAMPEFLIPFATGAPRALRLTAKMIGARPVGSLWIGGAAVEPEEPMTARNRASALQLGRNLVRI